MKGRTTLEVGADGVALITLINPPVNSLSFDVLTSLKESYEQALRRDDVKAIVVTGAKGRFSGGFDITAFGGLQGGGKTEESKPGYISVDIITDTLEGARKPSVAAIDGLALGGGLEVAMACHARVATSTAQLGLPELQLGVIPGFGGTQRLPRLVGLSKALEMMLMSKSIKGQEAQALGLVDVIAAPEELVSVARRWALDIVERRRPWVASLYKADKLEPLGEAREILKFARVQARKQAPNLEHPQACIDAVEEDIVLGPRAGLWKEADNFQKLLDSDTCKSLVHIFFAQRGTSKVPGITDLGLVPRRIKKIAILGGGLMGSGIAAALILSNYPVILKEVNDKFLQAGLGRVKANLQSRVKKGTMTQEKLEKTLSLLMGSLDYESFRDVDMVIEAVIENVALKQQIFADLEKYCPPHCILPSNTSTIDLNLIGEKTRSQDRIIGAHFFSPAHIMPLLEIVRTQKTSAQVIVDLLDVGKKIRKTQVVVGNCTGFAVNRMFFPYSQAAILLVERGTDVYQIDQAVTKFGMPMGPFRMVDLVGFGVAITTGTQFVQNFPERSYKSMLIPIMQEDKRVGRIAGFCAMCAIQNHVRCALQSTGRILAPKDLVKNIRCISRNFRNARQEDAHEYMVSLLESIHKCCLPTGLPSESPSAYEKSLVHKIFGGHLRSQVKCSECSYGSKKYDPFLDLSLEIAKADSLLKALEHFTAVEELDGGEKQYQCQQCKKKVKAVRQLTIHKAPYVLTMHLKRFGSTITGQKIDKNVHFGPTLDLKPFVSGTYEGDLNYTLYGVLVHAGWSSHSGHYYCFVRTSSGMWYALDDNEVFHVKERTVLEQKAYMLFYVRDRKNPTPRKPADLAPKRSADVVQTQNSVENHVENKEYSVTLLGCRETIQNDMLTTTSSTPAFSPIFTKVAPVTSASIQDSLLKNSCFFKPKGALMEGSVERVINLVQQSTHIHIRAENLSQKDPSAIDDSGNISHSCTESIDGKSGPLEHEEAKPTNQIMNECLPQNASSVVINGGFISHPNGPKPGVITEHEKSMQGTVATLAGCVVSEELASNPSTKDMERETHTVIVYEMVPSKTSCEILPLTVFEGCVDVAGVKAINDQGEAKATSNHFTAEVQLQISYSAFQESHVDSHPTDSQSKAINDPKKSIVTLPDCNVLQEVGSKAFATVGDHENAFINEKMSSNALSESLPEISLFVKGGETSTGTETKVANELEESKSADHCIEPEGVTQIVSPVVKDGDCISQDTGATIKAITEHEKLMKSIAVALDTLCECNVLQEVASMTSTTGMEQKSVSVNELAPGKALCKVGELMPEVVSSMQLLSETCTEEIVCKVSSLGPGKVPSQLAIEEELCKGVDDVKPEEINSIVFSSKSDTEETISKGANEIEPGEVNLFQLSNQLSTEEVPCLHVNVLEPGEVGTQFSSPSGLERTPCKRVHGLGPEGTDSTQLSNQVGSGGGQNSGNLNEGESSDLYTAEVNGPKPEEYESLYTLTQSSMTYRFDQQEALDNLHCQKVLKPNKHLIKFQASSTNLSSSRLLRACLRIHRKKKHKRSTKHSLEYDKSTQKDFGEESVSVLEPSTSEETQRVPFDSSFSQRRHQGNSGVNKRRRKRRLEHDKSTRKVFGEDSISGLEPSTSEDTQRIPFDSSCSQRCQGNSSVNKRRRKHRFEHGKSTQKVIGEESISSLEPSTFEETRTAAFDSSHTPRILVNSSAIKRHTRELAKDQVDSYAESAAKRLQIDLREKIGRAGTILANKEAPVKRSSSSLTAYSCESSESHGLQTRRSSVNDFMSMLTRGLEETTVARWSNIGGSHSSEIIGSRNGPSISIGYVPDEWDVEYGQGKRKKVKSKKSGLGSLNPFPEFAMTKNRLKKAKLDQSSSGNLPFRI